MENPSKSADSRASQFRDGVDKILSRPDEGTIRSVAEFSGPVLVLGAGGKIGLHLCLMLRSAAAAKGRDLRVIAVSRFKTLRDRETFTAEGIEAIAADLSIKDEIEALPEAPLVYFLAGVKFGTSSAPQLLEAMNSVMPRLVAERYRSSRIVAFSTGCVYPFVDYRTPGASEALAPAPVGEYATSCLRREEAFAEVSKRHGTKVVLMRLNYSVEYRYGVLVDIATKVLKGEPIDVSMGYVNIIWQSDAVAQIIQSASLAGSPPVPINITGPDIVSVRELAERFGRIFMKEPIITGSEKPTAWLSDSRKAQVLFGKPAHSLDVMVREVADWLGEGGETWGKPTGFEKRDGKF